MRSEPYHDELHTFRGDTKQRRHRRNGGSSCAMDERRCRHDMMMSLRRRGCSLANLPAISCEQTETSLRMGISAKDVRRTISLEQRVTGIVHSTSNNTRMSGYILVGCSSTCDGEVRRQALLCCSIGCCNLINYN